MKAAALRLDHKVNVRGCPSESGGTVSRLKVIVGNRPPKGKIKVCMNINPTRDQVFPLAVDNLMPFRRKILPNQCDDFPFNEDIRFYRLGGGNHRAALEYNTHNDYLSL